MLHAMVFEKNCKEFEKIIFFKQLPFVTVECIESEKSEGQTNLQTN